MKCKIPQKKLISALKVIKTSKALNKVNLSKIDSENEICLNIIFDKEENKIKFIASNIGVWVGISIDAADFISYDDPEEVYKVEESGEVFVESSEFISLVETFPSDCLLDMFMEENDGMKHFTVSILNSKQKGKKKSATFLSVIRPKFFEDNPPDEKRKIKIVDVESLVNAVNGVEFASELDPIRQHLWGIQLEIYGEKDIASCATDTLRLCWYDQEGIDRDEKPTIVTPIKSSLVSAVKNLDPKETVNVHIGKQYTILQQKGQWHGIPNAIQIGEDRMPEWRDLVRSIKARCRDFVDVPRKPLVNCLKSATASSAGRYGIRMIFDSSKKNVVFSVESIENNFDIRSHMTETEPLSDDCFGSEIRCTVSFRIEHLKEIVNKYKSDKIRFMMQGDNQTTMIIDQNASFQYISTVIRDISQ